MAKGIASIALLVVCAAALAGCSGQPDDRDPAGAPHAVGAAAGAFRATGNEPGWRLELDDVQLSFTIQGGTGAVIAPTPAPEATPNSRNYATAVAGRPLTIAIVDVLCADSMTGMPYPSAVTVDYAGRTYKGCGGDPAALLQGAEWVLEDIGGGIISDSRVMLNFTADGQVSGLGSCNHFTARYALTGEGLSISRAASTKMACAAPLMEQEQRFLDLLQRVQRFELTADGALILHASEQRRIVARRG
jgi:heat shock protein HslJ